MDSLADVNPRHRRLVIPAALALLLMIVVLHPYSSRAGMRVADLVGGAVLRPADASVRQSALAVGVSFAVNGALVATWISRLPAMKHDVGADPSGLGLALLCLAAGSMAAMTLCPRLVRRWGSRAVCRVVMVWTSVSVPLLALAPNVAGLALAFAVVGAGWGSGTSR